MKNTVLKLGIRAVAFLLIFLTILTILTLVFLPKRDAETLQSAQAAGFYHEPARTLDVLFLGSCNMYSSVSPVLLYEKYGITGYAFCCPDQEMSTSYTYLKEALKTQDLKAVVVESLFLTATNSQKREYYNRYAFDYTPLNLNKLTLAMETSTRESSWMRQYDRTAPDSLLTFAGYVFPLLRYHSRNDLSKTDLTFFLKNNLYNFYKGGFPEYAYTTNDGNYYSKVFNGDKINELSQKYVPKIKALCEEHGIPLIIVKSPNYARWGYDDKQTKIVRDFAAELGVPFLDYHLPQYNNYEIYDYGYQTGRLNVYGVRKFSDTMGAYLTEKVGLQPTVLSEEDKAAWDACVEKYYRVAKEKGCNLYPGELAQLSNLDGAICVRWNPLDDCQTYSIYRCEGKNGDFSLLTDTASGYTFNDTDVVSGQGYRYYVVPNQGAKAGKASEEAYYVYVDMPKNFSVTNENGVMRLTWEPVSEAADYRIQRRTGGDFNFSSYATTKYSTYPNDNVKSGYLYYYRLAAIYRDGNQSYPSMTTIVHGTPQFTPQITGVSASDGAVTLSWKKLTGQDHIQIWRSSSTNGDYTLIDTISSSSVQYTDKTVSAGNEYFYRIVSDWTLYGYYAESDVSNTVSAKVLK